MLEIPEHRWGPYLELVSLRAPDLPEPVARLFLQLDEAGNVVGLVAESAAGQRAEVPFAHPPVVVSTCPLETLRGPLLH